MFKEKESRITIKDQITNETQEAKLREMEEKLKAQKKQDTKKLVIHYIKEDLSKSRIYEKDENIEMPNDQDDPDDLEEYEAWKIRELKRIKVQAEEDEMKLKEKLEIERRRNLTDTQRKEENLRLGSDDTLRPFKSKLKFLQKYYHKGAFFSNERAENMDHVLNRDYNLPTWEDKIDRSNLPKILQKRRGFQFKKGQTKYTHLTGEDTTNFDPNFKLPENIHSRVMGYMGGLKSKDKFEIREEYNRKGKK
jgi:microfibrillar-associated protein 1